jgi:hypothetical protein
VAQLGARFHGMEEVVGSIPTRSTKFPNNSMNAPLPLSGAAPSGMLLRVEETSFDAIKSVVSRLEFIVILIPRPDLQLED